MKIAFNVTLDDLMAFQKYYLDSIHFFPKVKFYNILLFWIMTLFFSFYNFSDFDINYTRMGIMGTIFIVFSVIFLCTYEKRILGKIRKSFENNEDSIFVWKTIMTLDEQSLKINKYGRDQKFHWDYFLRYREDKDYIFIYNSEMSAYIIPKRSIKKDQLEEIEHLLEEKIKDE